MGDSISNQDAIVPKGNSGVVQLSDGGGDLKGVSNVYVTDDGHLNATLFVGDGGGLSNVSGGGGGVGTLQEVTDLGNTTSNTIQFTNSITSLTASGNVEVSGNVTASVFYGNAEGLSNIVNSSIAEGVYGNAQAVSQITIDSEHRITDISNVPIQLTLQEVTDLGNTTSNTIQFTNSITSLTASGNVEVSGNVTASVFYGNAEGLSNIVNSSIAEGVYGNAQAVSQITIDSNHRITDISNVPIQLTLQEVSDVGNTTSNTIQFTNSITSLTASGNVEVSGNVTASVFYGNAEGLSNIVNSSIDAGVYGNAQAVSQITIDSNHRITDISNVPIQLTLQEVSDVGNTTSNTIQFTNPLTSLKTTGNVAIGDGASETLSRLYVKGDRPAVVGIESTAVLSGIAFKSFGTGTDPATPAIGCMANDFVIYSGNPASEALRVYDGGNVEATNLFLGNANSLSNIVNSDITSGVYGNAQAVSQITISDDHRITAISNVPIQLTLQEISDVGNTTSNVVQFTATPTSLVATGNAVAYNTKVGTVSDTEISAVDDFFPTFVQGGISANDPQVRRQYVDSVFKWTKDTELLTVSNLLVSQDATVSGNLTVNGTTTTLNTENLIVEDPIIQLANGSAIQTADAGIVFTRPTTSNVAIGWRGDEDEFMVAFSTSSASGTTLTPIDNNEMKLKVYGNVEVTNLFLGNANSLSNIVNSDITPGVYGNSIAVSQITIGSDHRITDMSNVLIDLYNLNNVSVDTTTLNDNQILRYDGSNFINEYNNVTAIPIKAGESLSKGDVVYISDNAGDTPIVSKADASDPTKMPAIGVLMEGNLSLNDDGHVITFGIFGDSFNGLVGETMYVSNITPGLLSNIKPLGPTDGIQNIGIVENTDSKILVTGVGRTNDIPNAVEESNVSNVNYFYVETVNSRFEKIGLSDFRSNLQQVTDTGNVTSNTVQFSNSITSLTASGNVEVTGTANVGEITVNTSIGTTSLTTGNVFFDAENKSYRVSNISASGVFSGLDIANAAEGCQVIFELEASGGTLDVANTFTVAGSNLTSVKTNYSTNVSLSSGSFGLMTVFVRNSNAFVACTEFS